MSEECPFHNNKAMITLKELEGLYPWIKWREPVPITVLEGRKGYGCRICIAIIGYKPAEGQMPGFHEEREKTEEHIRKEHIE